MDGQMDKKVLRAGGDVIACKDDGAKSLSISTDFWGNKHRYGATSTGKGFEDVPLDEMTKEFPELIQLKNDLTNEGVQKVSDDRRRGGNKLRWNM